MTEKKVYDGPAVLSMFLPGLGQFMKGQIKKGLTFFIVDLLLLLCLKNRN